MTRGFPGGALADKTRSVMKAGQFASDEVAVWRVRRTLAGRAARLAVGFVVLPVAAAVLFAAATSVFGRSDAATMALVYGWFAAWLAGAPLSLLTAFLASLRLRRKVSGISVSDRDLRLEGDRPETIPARDIEGAIVVAPEDGASEAEIALRSGDVLHVRFGKKGSPKEGRALAAALGFGGKERRTVVPLGAARSPLWTAISAVVAGTLTTSLTTCLSLAAVSGSRGTDLALYGMGVVFTVVTLLVARLTAARRLVIGADGVEIQGPLRRRFFPRKQIFGVEKIRGQVSLLLGGGDDVTEVKLPAETAERGDALLAQIREALDGEAEESDPAAPLLARGADSIAAWRARLRKLVAPAEGYRARTVPVEALLRTAGDAEAPAELRVGAALAIAQSGDEDARRRLRIAADGVANEPVRRALEAAAEADAEDEAIAEACARVESSGRARLPP